MKEEVKSGEEGREVRGGIVKEVNRKRIKERKRGG